ncbi:competence protein ComJ [Paenibacillus sp. sgz500958]|uniref:competence protein ComJ n=1 Tax=Paenibacillus sp. sgz500958 TaxID=3242475 RepID=UPI0036D31246
MDMQQRSQEIELAISHSQIQVRSRDYNEDYCQWGDTNIAQGVIIQPGYITFDPLVEEAFGASVKLSVCEAFQADSRAERRMVVPFEVIDSGKLELLSVPMHAAIELPLVEGTYELYFEICQENEVYYRITFVPAKGEFEARTLLNDEWGGVEGEPLQEGYI